VRLRVRLRAFARKNALLQDADGEWKLYVYSDGTGRGVGVVRYALSRVCVMFLFPVQTLWMCWTMTLAHPTRWM
jgi:hypothetical protein